MTDNIEEVYNRITCNESREMTLERFRQAVNELMTAEDSEPYFGWCDVDGCKNEGSSGGIGWRETGYWTLCSKHLADHRAWKPCPKMKQDAIEREKLRD